MNAKQWLVIVCCLCCWMFDRTILPCVASFRPVPRQFSHQNCLKQSPNGHPSRKCALFLVPDSTFPCIIYRGGGGGGGGASVLASSTSNTPFLFSKSTWLMGWAVAIGAFFIRNYKYKTVPWPSFLGNSTAAETTDQATGTLPRRPSRRVWNFIHAVGSTIFSGTILVTTLLEWLVVKSGTPIVLAFWFRVVPILDVAVVVPALTATMISGVAQAVDEYGPIKEAPKYVKAVLHTLVTFGLFWAATDRTSQHGALQALQTWLDSSSRGPLPGILFWRRASNLTSCCFVMALYALMVLKPGRPDLPPIR